MSFLSKILEYKSFYEEIVAFDRSNIGRLLITGNDAHDLLERLTTNKIIDLPINNGVKTVITTNKGRIIDVLYIYSTDKGLLVLTSKNNQNTIMSWIDYYTFGEDIAIKDISNTTAMIGVVGPKSFHFLEEFLSINVFKLNKNELTKTQLGNIDLWIIRTDSYGMLGVDIVFPIENQDFIWEKIMSTSFIIEEPSESTLNTIRINEGVPLLGNELNQDYNPLEAGLIESINFQKGCYVGQEVIARLNTYHKVKRSLVKIKWDSKTSPSQNVILDESNKEVGNLTSISPVPSLNKYIGLGYLNKKMIGHPSLFVPLMENLAEIDIVIS